jgi:hypothetical protein
MNGGWKGAIHGTDYNYKYAYKVNNNIIYVDILTDGSYKVNYS